MKGVIMTVQEYHEIDAPSGAFVLMVQILLSPILITRFIIRKILGK